MEEKEHLSLLGAGPFYVATISSVTFAALILHYCGIIPVPELSTLSAIVMKIASVLLVAVGVIMWVSAVFSSKIRNEIRENYLVTDGVYGLVRHPVYSAITLAQWGILLWAGNLWMFLLLPLYWLFLSVLMKNTEEKWLHDVYGKEYEDYCKCVNRCIPWMKK